MSGKLLIGPLSRAGTTRVYPSLNLWGQLNRYAHTVAQKTQWTKDHKMGELISFSDFKRTQVESWEVFKDSPAAKAVYGDNIQKITLAYERYCLSRYAEYKHQVYGGNPSQMI